MFSVFYPEASCMEAGVPDQTGLKIAYFGLMKYSLKLVCIGWEVIICRTMSGHSPI